MKITDTDTDTARRRRARDRIIDRDGTENEQLSGRHELSNHLLLIDDELRETALALGNIERFLVRTLATIERKDLTREELDALAGDVDVEDTVADLEDTLGALKRRMRKMAAQLDE